MPAMAFARSRFLSRFIVPLALAVAVFRAAAADEGLGEIEVRDPAMRAMVAELPRAETVSLPWRPGRFQRFILADDEEGAVPARRGHLTGVLFHAPGEGPAPYAVLLAGCGHPNTMPNNLWLLMWARVLRDIGVGALALDSFSTRGVSHVCGEPSRSWAVRRVDDAHAALAWLAEQPFVDARRVFIMGMSNGGRVALLSVSTAESWRWRRFAAAVALYPVCDDMPPHPLMSPALLLLGAADAAATPQSCQAYLDARPGRGATARMIAYPQAHHLFDVFPRDDDFRAPEVIESRAHALEFLKDAGLSR